MIAWCQSRDKGMGDARTSTEAMKDRIYRPIGGTSAYREWAATSLLLVCTRKVETSGRAGEICYITPAFIAPSRPVVSTWNSFENR